MSLESLFGPPPEWAADPAAEAASRPASAYMTHPHFLCICLRCGSGKVYVEPAFVWQPGQGMFSRVCLVCQACGERAELFDLSPTQRAPHVFGASADALPHPSPQAEE